MFFNLGRKPQAYELEGGGTALGVPFFALDDRVGNAIRRRNLVEYITGISLVAKLVTDGIHASTFKFVPDVVALRETPHTAAYAQISRAETAGMIAPGSAHTCITDILNGVFDGTVGDHEFLPREQSIKHVLELLGVEPLS